MCIEAKTLAQKEVAFDEAQSKNTDTAEVIKAGRELEVALREYLKYLEGDQIE